MSLFNDKLGDIRLKEVLSLIIFLFLIQYFLNAFNIINLDSFWIYLVLILYFIYKLRDNLPEKSDFTGVFGARVFGQIIMIVVLNVFLSYGFLYLSNHVLNFIPSFGLSHSITGIGLLATILISPISEELIFRGVFLNRLKLVVPTVFAVLISSLLFASLHTYGSITSAFIFGVCMAILYLKTGNVLVAIFAHFLNNLLAELIVIIDSGKVLFTNGAVVGVMSVLAVISFVLVLWFIVRELKYINNNKV